MKKFLLSIFALTFLFPVLVSAQVSAGFVDQPIWFSSAPEKVGETVNISTLINNQDSKAIYGSVGFYDNDTLLSKKNVTVNSGASSVVTISWKVTAGEHSIVAKFENTKAVDANGASIEVANQKTSAYKFTVKAPAQTSKTENSASGKQDNLSPQNPTEKSDTIAGGVEEAKKVAENTFEAFDNFRTETAENLEKNISDSEKEVEALKAEKAEEKSGQVAGAKTENIIVKGETRESFAKTPFAYLKLYFYKMAHFIFAHKVLFYSLVILIVILFIRYLIRAPR